MKRSFLCVLLALALALSLAAPAFAAEDTWQSSYTTVINQKASRYGNIIQLVDLDTDGIPELLIGGIPGSGLFSEILYAYTYKYGQLQALTMQGVCYLSTASPAYTLYRDNSSGKLKVEGSTTLRAGMGYYANATFNYWLSGTTLGMTNTFTKDVAGNSTTYYIGSQKTTASKYTSAYNSRHSGWSKVWSFRYAQATSNNKKITSQQITQLLSDYGTGAPVQAAVSTHKVQVDGKPITIAAYSIGGNNFFMLRDVASILNRTEAQFQVAYDPATQAISLTTGQSYTAVGGELTVGGTLSQLGTPTPSAIYIDGVQASFTAFNIGGNNYFKLRDLGKALGFQVTWDDSTNTVGILSDQPYQE